MCGAVLAGLFITTIWGSCENNAVSWGSDPMDSGGRGVAQPWNFYQAPHELASQVVLRPPTGFEARPLGLKPAPATSPSGYIILGSYKTGP